MPPPNLAISNQMTMKLGKDILWIKIFTKLTKKFMTSSSCSFYDVIKMQQLKKVEGFQGFFMNISKTVQRIFTKLISFLGNHL